QLLAERGAAGLTGRDHVAAFAPERFHEQLCLRGLSRPVQTFEGDEHRGRTIRRVRAVVTGGAGFIGSHVVDALLARGDEVDVLDDLSHGKRANVPADAELYEVDIRGEVD